ncbi:hypothetical protein M5689_016579 [Euphorbia peplus]|nr:hypothetical protein M5689_016579 [Euphorbia peplus]
MSDDLDCDCDCGDCDCGDCDCDFCGWCCTGGNSDSGSWLNNFVFFLCINTDTGHSTRREKKKNHDDSCCCCWRWCRNDNHGKELQEIEKGRKESKPAPRSNMGMKQEKEDKKREELRKERKDALKCTIHGSNNVTKQWMSIPLFFKYSSRSTL